METTTWRRSFLLVTKYFSRRQTCLWVGSGVMATVDIVTGNERWRFNAGQKVYSVTVGTNGLLYCGYQKIFALDQTTGEKVWEFDAVDQTFDMALSKEGHLYVISGAGYLHALNVHKMARRFGGIIALVL